MRSWSDLNRVGTSRSVDMRPRSDGGACGTSYDRRRGHRHAAGVTSRLALSAAAPAGILTGYHMLTAALARALVPTVVVLLAATWAPATVAAGETLAEIRSRGTLRCGVSDGIAGFSAKDGSGRWSGLDVDFCRALAAAALGDASKVTFVPLPASARFPALRLRTIDLLARNTTWTLGRETALKVIFAGVLFHDGQAFMVESTSPVKAL